MAGFRNCDPLPTRFSEMQLEQSSSPGMGGDESG
jgi:hypothetical protein